ncbi:MAG: spore coat U domain-containing protein [Xanthomonadales bacterium]|nr:spore coat U domain-containing protein [Xanthomonadales bacterium]
MNKPAAAALLAAIFALLAGPAQAQTCSYSVSPSLDFGTVTGLPTPQVDVTATITVTCSALLNINYRVCLSIPVGDGGASVADRRMTQGGHALQYQIYSDAARSNIWGAVGESSLPVAVDFRTLALNIPVTQQVTVYGRLFAGQTGKAVGMYSSSLAPIIARRANFVFVPPSCATVSQNASTLSPLTARATLQPQCIIHAAPLSFGTVSGLSGHAANTNLAVNCTLGGAYSIALDGGTVSGDVNARRMRLGPGPASIDYQLYRDSGLSLPWGNSPGNMVTGTGTGTVQSIPVHGWVPPQAAKPAGTYVDTITATITY